MVASFATQNAACEDQSVAWSNQQASYAPIAAANHNTNSGSTHRGRRSPRDAQNDAQNSVNNDAKKSGNRRWTHHVDAQAAVSLTSLMWNGADGVQTTSSVGSGSASKVERSSRKAAREAAASAQREKAFYRRIKDWDVSTTSPAPTAADGDACDREVQRVVVAQEGSLAAAETKSCGESDGSGGSSPALSASSGSKQSADSPVFPSLTEEVLVQAAASTTTTSVPSVLLHTLPDVTSAAPPQVAAPSYITPCVSFTASPSSSPSPHPSTPSSTPSFTMADVAAALRSTCEDQHPFLDMQYQRSVREHERVQEQVNQQVVQSFQSQFSGMQQAAAFKCLLNAAHRRQYYQCMARDVTEESAAEAAVEGARSPSSAGRWGPHQRRLINRQWRVVAEQSECDLYREGLGAVQRKLSCMCLFNPDTDVRVYDENAVMREQRCYRQHKLLIRLQRQRVRGGNPYFLNESH